jgi:FkbM family methyltransferase
MKGRQIMPLQSREFTSRFLIKHHLANSASEFARKCGFCVTRASNTLREKRLETLSRLSVETVLDIGANTGQWARELRNSGYRGRIISFEPAPEPFTQLKTSARFEEEHICVHAALADRDGEGQLLITNATVLSSFRTPIHDRYTSNCSEVKERVTVPIRRLDSIVPTLTCERDRFYMKIDTQGFEKEVLSGASGILSRTDAVEVELSLVDQYEEQALLPEIWQLLVSSGLRPAWLERGYRDPVDVWLLQGLFIREEVWNLKKRAV